MRNLLAFGAEMLKTRFVEWLKDHVIEIVALILEVGSFGVVATKLQEIAQFASNYPVGFYLLLVVFFCLGFAACYVFGFAGQVSKSAKRRERKKLEFKDACNRINAMDWASKEILLGVRDGEYSNIPTDEWKMLRRIPTLHGFLRGAEFAKDKTHVELTELARKAMKACPDALDIERDIAD